MTSRTPARPAVSGLIPLEFAVIRDDRPASVLLSFASNEDVQASKQWRVSSKLRGDPTMKGRAADACEFARLAAKRWRHYRDTETAASSLPELECMIADEPQGEFCFHLKVTAEWFPGVLGAAMVRRTWCHHLMIDFLFVHPDISGKVIRIKTVGVQILQAICLLARHLGCKRVWGEATHDSAPFYQYQLDRPIEDHFSIEQTEITHFAERIQTFSSQG